MRITLIGLGRVGKIAAQELVARGHYVVGIDKFADESTTIAGKMEVHKCDIEDTGKMVSHMEGSDAIFNAISPNLEHPESYREYILAMFDQTKKAGVSRFLSIIGSSSIIVNTGEKLVYSDYFEETNRIFYLNICETEEIYQKETELDWACITPAAFMELYEPVLRTYRKSYDDHLVTTDESSMRYFEVSEISLTDFAYACCDELETPTAHHQRICVAY